MPRYDYKCDKCGEVWTYTLPMNHTLKETYTHEIPSCKGMMRRIFSTFAIRIT